MTTTSRVLCPQLRQRIMTAEQAAALITSGDNVGMSGFTGAGYPKAVPQALAAHIRNQAKSDKSFRIGVWTGASTAPELDGALAEVDGIEMRMPYQSDPVCRQKINEGKMQYIDIHLSHVAQHVWSGFFGKLNVAVIEVAGITEEGQLIPSTSVGNNKTWIDLADKVILEVNSGQSAGLEGMHDIYNDTALPPHRKPVMINTPADRIGDLYLRCPLKKVIAVVETCSPDRNSRFSSPDENSQRIADHHFLHRGAAGRHAGHAEIWQTGNGLRHRPVTQPGSGG